jgi:hypothetical protein
MDGGDPLRPAPLSICSSFARLEIANRNSQIKTQKPDHLALNCTQSKFINPPLPGFTNTK